MNFVPPTTTTRMPTPDQDPGPRGKAFRDWRNRAGRIVDMRIDEHIAVLRREGKLMVEAVVRADVDAQVPTCPE